MRNTNKLVGWCVMASSYVRAREDREQVKDELWAHIEDRYDSLIAGGVDDERAAELTLEAMGDAHEVGKLLRKIHKPYLSWAVEASKWLMILAALVCVYIGVFEGFAANLVTQYSSDYEDTVRLTLETRAAEAMEAGDTVVRLSAEDTAECEGYTFSTEDAVWIYQQDDGRESSMLWFGLRAVNPMPWRGSPDAVLKYLYAVDDLGNLYPNRRTVNYNLDYELCGNASGRSWFSHYYKMWIDGLPANAQWVELRYDRYGRVFSLRIELEGGENR